MLKQIFLHALSIYMGWLIGIFASLGLGIWSFSLYTVFGEGRDLSGLHWSKAKFPPIVALKRLLVRMPLLALIHPLPWVVAGTLYFLWFLVSENTNSMIALFGLSFFGSLGYGIYKILSKSTSS